MYEYDNGYDAGYWDACDRIIELLNSTDPDNFSIKEYKSTLHAAIMELRPK